MSQTDDPITAWINDLQQGDDVAAKKLWEHFFDRLKIVAKNRLQKKTRVVYDENDAAQSAFISFCNGISAGRFPNLSDRDELWRLLLVITARKVTGRHRHDHQDRRNVSRVVDHAVFSESSDNLLNQNIQEREPSPEFAAEFADLCEDLMSKLIDPDVQDVARLKLEGNDNEQIAKQLDCSRRTVQRRLEIIRRTLQNGELP